MSFAAVVMRSRAATFNGTLAVIPSAETQLDTPNKIMAALTGGSLDRRAIANRCNLTPSQVRYALKKLIESGRVIMDGGWGARNTTYSLSADVTHA